MSRHDRLEQIRHALRRLGFEVACTDSVLLGDHPVPIREIAEHGLPWVLANWFHLDAGGTPPSPASGYPSPQPPSALALPTQSDAATPPPERKKPDQPLQELTTEEVWGDSSLWGETSMIGEDDDHDLLSPFEAGFHSDDDIDDDDDQSDLIPTIEAPDGALIVWVPEQFSERLMEMLGISPDGDGEPDPDAVMRLMRVLRHLKKRGRHSRGKGADQPDSSELSEQERRMLDAFGLGERTSTDSGDDF